MAQITRETVTTSISPNASGAVPATPVRSAVTSRPTDSYTVQNLVYFIFGILEFLLLFRIIFKLMGANPSSGFVSFIYGITAPFLAPFFGIFRPAVSEGVETVSVLEPAAIIALPVYALIAWGIVKLIAILSKEPEVQP